MKGCRPLTNSEITGIASELSFRDRAIFIMGIRTGLRIREILSLNVGDVINEYGKIRDAVLVKKSNTKGSKEGRVISMHPEAKEAVSMYLEADSAPMNAPLFRTGKGRIDDSWFRKALKKAAKLAKLQNIHLISSHTMRKTFAKKFYEGCGKDLYLLQQALGHSHVGITIKYLQESNEVVQDIILRLK